MDPKKLFDEKQHTYKKVTVAKHPHQKFALTYEITYLTKNDTNQEDQHPTTNEDDMSNPNNPKSDALT